MVCPASTRSKPSMVFESVLESARRAIAGTSADSKGKTPESPEGIRRPLLRVDLSPRQSFGPPPSRGTYGATEDTLGLQHSVNSSVRGDSYLHQVPEEEEDDDTDDWDFERQGINDGMPFYINCSASNSLSYGPRTGSYNRQLRLYALVPLTSLATLVVLAILPRFLWHTPPPPTHLPLLPHPLPAILLSAGLWSLSYLLHLPVFTLCSTILPFPHFAAALSTALHVLLRDTLRLLAVPLLLGSSFGGLILSNPSWKDPSFGAAWWLAIGWSFAEVSASAAQGYSQLLLYADASSFDPGYAPGTGNADHTDVSPLRPVRPAEGRDPQERLWVTESPVPAETELVLERELDRLVTLKARQELEDVYGMPVTVSLPRSFPCRRPRSVSSLFVAHTSIRLLPAAHRLNRSHPRLHSPPLRRLLTLIRLPSPHSCNSHTTKHQSF